MMILLRLLCTDLSAVNASVTNALFKRGHLISLSCASREGRGSRPAGQRPAGRQRALRRPGGNGEACRVQSADRGAGALLQLRQHAEACPGQWASEGPLGRERALSLNRLVKLTEVLRRCRTMRSTCWAR